MRELEEIQQGNIPSSLPLPLSKLDDALKMTPGDFEAAFGFHKPEPDAPIVVYCRSGKRSTSAKEKMESKDLKANRYTKCVFDFPLLSSPPVWKDGQNGH